MAAKESSAAHVENPEHEALLAGAVSLASLFASCVEVFSLVHPSPKWDKQEQLLLTKLGIQQARLLVWGSVMGIASPPATVTDRAIPKRPSSAYPDLNEPTFFEARDPKLDDPALRTVIEENLSAIVDRSAGHSREEMMAKYGLKPPKRYTNIFEPAMDTNRLESFRERHELLREVAESYAHLSTPRRNNSIIHSSWTIADITKFGSFIRLTQEKIDSLIELTNVKENVDRGVKMDIRMFGWHIAPDRVRTANDVSKLRLLQEVCREDYLEYVLATQQALDNIQREIREAAMPNMQFGYKQQTQQQNSAAHAQNGQVLSATDTGHHHKKRPGLLKIFRSFGKSSSPAKDAASARSKSLAEEASSGNEEGPLRSQSHPGPLTNDEDDEVAPLGRVRSKSVGAYSDPPLVDEALRARIEKLGQVEEIVDIADLPQQQDRYLLPLVGDPVQDPTLIRRHDQYHGIARVATKDLSQPGGNFGSG